MRSKLWPLRLAVRTLPFHGENTGSIPVGVTPMYITQLYSIGLVYLKYVNLFKLF